ncbi:hypothetical protein BJ875DRAFT_148877 [Amylocarpus encephaloides]|uniref:Uncharacterized protein n=1 Tax=Amylocarpus encephaloides TaxID=45428 RepID=A0A9P7YPE6_9HELO|nr:hypothetical protein BJ875DRAFT_148877 [Amylocarpus encephaloides]
MPLVTSQIVIAASPAAVRAKFLDFTQIPKYSGSSIIQSIAPKTSKVPTELTKGDVLRVSLGGGMSFSPTVLENSEQAFIWRGYIPLIICGDHGFRFKEVEGNNQVTLFEQDEEYTGTLSFLANWKGQKEKQMKHFDEFNRHFKKWVEEK